MIRTTIRATNTADKADAVLSASTSMMPHQTVRIRSQDLFQQGREVEIEHEGRIYRMRLTHLNKLILTA